MNRLHPVLAEVTARIVERSSTERTAYLDRLDRAAERGPARGRLACANLAHGFAASGPADKAALRGTVKPNVAIVSAYNDMLSAHQPFESFPARIKKAVLRSGGIAQFAGGVPAMCDGITQGRDGMQLSLFSRDVIAMSTAIALSHDMFDATVMLGVCDKIVPGMLIGALSFGHLPTVFVPAGPMTSGLPNDEKARIRQRYAAGEIGREELLEAEAASYHSAGTCTFYGTANSNQMLMEVMGLHLPGASFVNPGTPLRDALTDAAAARATALTSWGEEFTPVGRIVDEKAIVNGCVALLATGGSTNHTLHLVAIARAAGITLTWDDLSDLSAVVPLLARVYPNGKADVNHFHAAGGLAFVVHSLLKAGLLHDDVRTVAGHGLWRYTTEARLDGAGVTWEEGPKASHDTDVLRGADDPFESDGGLRMLDGALGRAVVKTSAVKPEHRQVKAPARVFDDQADFLAAFSAGELDGDFVAVLRFQGPAANGMPELHKLTPALGVLQDRGQRVALVTDGRMSGASGKVPAAIHLTPEAAVGGRLAKVRDGDLLTLDSDAGVLDIHVSTYDLDARTAATPDDTLVHGTGRELFSSFRAAVGPADQGASVFHPTTPTQLPSHLPSHLARPPMTDTLTPPAPAAPSTPPSAASLLDRVPVVPVVVLHDADHAVPVARALVEGGLPVIELTLRTPAALDAIEAIATHVPEILVGAGTVLTAAQAKDAQSAGAQFLVSPGTTEELAVAMQDTGLPHLPGASTVSEVLRLLELGYRELKFFPAEAAGGVAFLKALTSPVPQARVLPDGRHHGVERGGVPRPAQRRLRRRLLAHPGRRRGRRQLGAHRLPGQRGNLPGLTHSCGWTPTASLAPPARASSTAASPTPSRRAATTCPTTCGRRGCCSTRPARSRPCTGRTSRPAPWSPRPRATRPASPASRGSASPGGRPRRCWPAV